MTWNPPARRGGYKALNMNRLGDMPIFDEIQEHVIDAGLAAGDGSNLGTVLYNRGMYAAMLAAEAIRKAQEIHGVADITPAMMRDGMEALEMTNARWKSWACPASARNSRCPARTTAAPAWRSCSSGTAREQWVTLTDFIAPDDSVTQPLIDGGLGPVCRGEQHLQPVRDG
jgi:branched-chain amino acid transport system substrate-binding protein